MQLQCDEARTIYFPIADPGHILSLSYLPYGRNIPLPTTTELLFKVLFFKALNSA